MTFEIQKVSVDYKTITGAVYANAKMHVTLLTAVALDSPEIAPTMEFDFTADALGVGEFEIVVPSSGGFSFGFRLPDFKTYTAVVGYTGVTAVPLADILADSYTPPDEAVLESYVKKDGSTAMTGELPLSGNPIAALGAAPKQYVDTAQAAAEAASLARVGDTWNGEQNAADNLLTRPVIKGYGETVNAIGAIGGGSQDINLTLGNVVTATVDTSATTFTLSNPPASGTAGSFTMLLTNGGSQTITWFTGIDWGDAGEPALTAAGVDILTFVTIDAGTIVYGFKALTGGA